MGTIRYLLVLVFLTTIYQLSHSQANNVIPNGYNKFYYGDGQISSEGPMRDGKPDGYWKTYFVNGQIKSEGNRKNFQLDSLWLFYDEQGNITKRINYKDDKKNGYYEVYKLVKDSVEKNVLIAKELYINDLKQGVSKYYYDNGTLHLQINYEDNRKSGNGIEFDENGTVISELKYRNDITISKNLINRYNRNGEKNGTWKYFYPDGSLQTEAYYKNGKLNGYVKEYDPRGKLLSSKRYIDGDLFVEKETPEEKVIVKKEYYDNGKLKSAGSFKNDVPVGQHTTYTKTGKILESKKYSSTGWVLSKGIMDKRGKRQGEWTYFYKSGKVKSVGSYKNGRRIGDWTFYHENGKNEQIGKYDKRGKPEGLWMWYHDNGNVLREEEFDRGIENGRLIEYSRDGTIVSKGTYVDGLKEDAWYYDVGDEIQEGSYKADLKDGVWKHYYPDKTLKMQGSYVDGVEQGKFKYYYPDGKIKMEGEYAIGEKHKEWKFYNEDGILRTSITYQLGEEIKIDGKKLTDNTR